MVSASLATFYGYQQQQIAQKIVATIEPVLTCEDQSVRTLGCLNPSTIKCHI